MLTRYLLFSLLLTTLMVTTSCQGLNRIPMIPDSVIDNMERHLAVTQDGDRVEYYEVEGFRVTFFPGRMHLIIEKTDSATDDPDRTAH